MSRAIGQQFSFLHKGYTSVHFYWEFIILYRKVALIAVSVFFSLVSTVTQAISVLAVILVYMSLQVRYKPYLSPTYHRLELKSLVTSLLTLYIGLYFQASSISLEISGCLFAVILISNAYFLFSWCREVVPLILDTFLHRMYRVASLQSIQPNTSNGVVPENSSVIVDPETIVIRANSVLRLSTV